MGLLLQCFPSYSQETVPGLKSSGNGLSSGNIFLSDGQKKIDHTQFVYGEKFFINFENMEGFQMENNKYHPGMGLYVLNKSGDTLLANHDMYADLTEGTDIDPLTLNCNVTVADPLHSGQNYIVHVRIYDKKSKGSFEASLEFSVKSNPHIQVEKYKMSCEEIYLFSRERGITITNNQAGFDEHIYLLFEGLKGVKEKNGKGEIGLKIKAEDAEGHVIVEQADLFKEQEFNIKDIQEQIAPSLMINKGLLVNPVYFEVIIWDKNSKSRITAWVNLEIL